MKSVREIAREIVRREGGYVNDPDDRGGATKYGVTIHTMRRLGFDLDGDGDVDVNDVKSLTLDQAVDIYVTHYFDKVRINLLPEELHASVFDFSVNSGPSRAVKMLQRLLNDLGYDLVEDGQIGPNTARAAHDAMQDAPVAFRDAYGIARRNYLYRIADRRPASRKYARRRNGGKGGWITRAEEFISPKLHLTVAQHRQRVSTWA